MSDVKSTVKKWMSFLGLFVGVFLIIFFLTAPLMKKYKFREFLETLSGDLPGGIISVVAKYEGEEDYLLNFNGDELIHPGSNFKLFTAASAFYYLKPDFTFKTSVYEKGDNLVLVGMGDPDLNVRELVSEIHWQGDRLFYDDSYFEGEVYGPGWNSEWYEEFFSVPVSALQTNNNLLDVLSDQSGVRTFPLKDAGRLTDERKNVENLSELKNPVKASFDLSEGVRLTGDVLADMPSITSATVKDPSLFTAKVVAESLGAKNVEVFPGGDYGELLYEHHSDTLEDIIFRMLKHSLNNYAETLVRTLGEEIYEGVGNSQAKGVAVLSQFVELAGVENSEFVAFDGSGMSEDTRVSSVAILKLFEFIEKQPWGVEFFESLPEASKYGTLKQRFDDLPKDVELRAKTGTHVGANSLSGKIIRKNKPNINFSVHVYGHTLSTAQAAAEIVPLIDHIVISLNRQF